MFDVSWRKEDEQKNMGYHHYSLSTHEDAEGFCEYLKYQGYIDIKINESVPYTRDNVKEFRDILHAVTTDIDMRNIDIVNKYLDGECEPGDVPLTIRYIVELADKYNIDYDKPILIDTNGNGFYPLENMYVTEFIEEDDMDEVNNCLAISL